MGVGAGAGVAGERVDVRATWLRCESAWACTCNMVRTHVLVRNMCLLHACLMHARACARMLALVRAHMPACASVCACVRARVLACVRAWMRASVSECMRARARACVCIRAC
eukprot:12315623-Alexandrium_andersonii.AAC.1